MQRAASRPQPWPARLRPECRSVRSFLPGLRSRFAPITKNPAPLRDGNNPRCHPCSPPDRGGTLGGAITGATRPGLLPCGHQPGGSGASSGVATRRASTFPGSLGALDIPTALHHSRLIVIENCDLTLMIRDTTEPCQRRSHLRTATRESPILSGASTRSSKCRTTAGRSGARSTSAACVGRAKS